MNEVMIQGVPSSRYVLTHAWEAAEQLGVTTVDIRGARQDGDLLAFGLVQDPTAPAEPDDLELLQRYLTGVSDHQEVSPLPPNEAIAEFAWSQPGKTLAFGARAEFMDALLSLGPNPPVEQVAALIGTRESMLLEQADTASDSEARTIPLDWLLPRLRWVNTAFFDPPEPVEPITFCTTAKALEILSVSREESLKQLVANGLIHAWHFRIGRSGIADYHYVRKDLEAIATIQDRLGFNPTKAATWLLREEPLRTTRTRGQFEAHLELVARQPRGLTRRAAAGCLGVTPDTVSAHYEPKDHRKLALDALRSQIVWNHPEPPHPLREAFLTLASDHPGWNIKHLASVMEVAPRVVLSLMVRYGPELPAQRNQRI